MPDREVRLTASRQSQPLARLERKAAKAMRRQNISTVEEQDLAVALVDRLDCALRELFK
jgi:hypothetical protein